MTTMTFANGVDVGRLTSTIDAVRNNPELAEFQFRGTTRWDGGSRAVTSFDSFYGAGSEHHHKQTHTIEGDEPDVLLGTDTAPNAVETLLASLTSCLAVGYAYNAAAQGIEIEDLTFQVEGDIDLHPFLGLGNTPRPGFESIRVSYQVKSSAPRQKLEELCEYVQQTSPVFDMIANKVPVSIEMTA